MTDFRSSAFDAAERMIIYHKLKELVWNLWPVFLGAIYFGVHFVAWAIHGFRVVR